MKLSFIISEIERVNFNYDGIKYNTVLKTDTEYKRIKCFL